MHIYFLLALPFVRALFLSPIVDKTFKCPDLLQPFVNEIEEPSAIQAFSQIIQTKVKVPSSISISEVVAGTYCSFSSTSPPKLSLLPFIQSKRTPIVLLHGFDSSFLEFRRLSPLLSLNHDVFVPDILGWGFIDHSNVQSFTPASKIEYLKCFIEQVVGKPCILVGASLGGALAITIAADYPELVERVVLIDAQGFIDGTQGSKVPDAIGK